MKSSVHQHRHCEVVAVAFLSFVTLEAAAQDQSWLLQFGTTEEDGAACLAADGMGGCFIAGSTGASLGGEHDGVLDVWLARYDASGNRTWIIQFGTIVSDLALAAAPDGEGGVFLAGWTYGRLGDEDFDKQDAWLARYDGSGNRIWLRQLGTVETDKAHALAPDGSGGVFIGGYTSGDFGGGSAGGHDAWIARYDSAGQRTWIVQFGSDDGDILLALASDGAGGAFAAGSTSGDFDGQNAGATDGWLARFDPNGDELWRLQLGTSALDSAHALLPDGDGGVFIAGETWGELGGANLGEADVWVARFHSAGEEMWMAQWGSEGDDGRYTSVQLISMAPDGNGGFVLGGSTQGSFDGESTREVAAWLSQFTGDGNQEWIRQLDSELIDLAFAMTSDGAGGVFFAGDTNGELGGPHLGKGDAWLTHYTVGQRANLTGFSMNEGEVISGNERKLRSSNSKYLKLASEFTPGGNPPHEVRLEVKLKSTEDNPDSLLVTVESRLNQNGGTAKVYLRNWNTGEWDRVHTYPIGKSETVVAIADLNPNRYIRESGLIRVRIEYERVTGEFNALIDHVQALVR